jgi:hypothetical protein
MSTAWARKYGSPIVSSAARLELAACVHQCGTDGCENLAMDQRFCNRCREELEALEQNSIEREFKRQDREERLQRVLEMWPVCWDWAKRDALDLALLLFVAWAVGYIVATCSDAWVMWFLGLAG